MHKEPTSVPLSLRYKNVFKISRYDDVFLKTDGSLAIDIKKTKSVDHNVKFEPKITSRFAEKPLLVDE